jgi:hypothetical protein
MSFWKDEIWHGEIVPSFKGLVRGIIKGIKWIVEYLKNAFKNWMTSGAATVNEVQNKTIQHAWEIKDWQMLMAGIMLLLIGLSAHDPKVLAGLKERFNPEKKNELTEPIIEEADLVAVDVQKPILGEPETVTIEPQKSNQSGTREGKIADVEAVNQPTPEPTDNSYEIVFIDRIEINKEAFTDKLIDVCNRLLIHPDWLMIVMRIESRFRRKSINVYSGTVGLIQWTIGNAARHLGMAAPRKLTYDSRGHLIVTPQILNIQTAMQNKTGVQQLEYVYEYLSPYIGRLNSVFDVYFAIFYPVAMNKKDSFVLGSERSVAWMRKVYDGNENLDLVFGDKDGKLEVSDVKAWVKSHFPKGYINTTQND